MVKKILFVLIICVAVSCGGKGEGGAKSSDATSSPVAPEERHLEPIVKVDPEACEVKFLKTDTFSETAKKAHRSSVLCNLSEEEIIALVELSLAH